MREAITAIADDVEALIFDLRNNTGGVLDGAIEICDLFLEPGKLIVSTKGRNNTLLSRHVAREKPLFPTDKPVVVLVNRESASASEIVAACLQDHQRAVVAGESTWGKGTVQNVIPMQRGRSALKLTTASYWRPSGRYIDRYDEQAKTSGVWGVQPDAELKLELSEEEIFANRRRRSLLDLRGLVDPQDLIDRDEEILTEAADRPLQRSIDFLMKQIDQRAAA
jgi:carboxyl-terminal processing protease